MRLRDAIRVGRRRVAWLDALLAREGTATSSEGSFIRAERAAWVQLISVGVAELSRRQQTKEE